MKTQLEEYGETVGVDVVALHSKLQFAIAEDTSPKFTVGELSVLREAMEVAGEF